MNLQTNYDLRKALNENGQSIKAKVHEMGTQLPEA